jgi:hypothetical protein
VINNCLHSIDYYSEITNCSWLIVYRDKSLCWCQQVSYSKIISVSFCLFCVFVFKHLNKQTKKHLLICVNWWHGLKPFLMLLFTSPLSVIFPTTIWISVVDSFSTALQGRLDNGQISGVLCDFGVDVYACGSVRRILHNCHVSVQFLKLFF